jgi:ParB family transcriptional regulator, chromosome partitioning protein
MAKSSLDFSGLSKASQLLDADAAGIREIPLDQVRPDPDQPRKYFDKQALGELAESLREHGIIQPLVVKVNPNPEGGFLIVAGERRWRAAAIAELATVPIIIRDDLSTFAQVVENIQRENLTPMELYRWIAAQLDVPDMTQGALAAKLGKSKTWISFYASISKMPDTFQAALNEGLAADITALNQLFKLWKQEPALADKLVTSGVPITRHSVAALAQKIQDKALAADGKEGSPKAASKAKGTEAALGAASASQSGTEGKDSAQAANDGSSSASSAGQGESERGGTPAALSFPGAQTAAQSPTGALPVRILARYDGDTYAVRYTAQRTGEDGPEVMLENEGGLTVYAPLKDLQVTSITVAPAKGGNGND